MIYSQKKDRKDQPMENNSYSSFQPNILPANIPNLSGKVDSKNASKEETSSEKTPGLKPKNSVDFNKIIHLLIRNTSLRLIDELDYTFTALTALLRITLDMSLGSLVFQSRRELAKEQQATRDELFNNIEKELLRFQQERPEVQPQVNTTKTAGIEITLSIKISKPHYFDAFIQQLLEKNLLPTQNNNMKQDVTKETSSVAPEVYQSTAPTPFEMRPSPKDYDVVR